MAGQDTQPSTERASDIAPMNAESAREQRQDLRGIYGSRARIRAQDGQGFQVTPAGGGYRTYFVNPEASGIAVIDESKIYFNNNTVGANVQSVYHRSAPHEIFLRGQQNTADIRSIARPRVATETEMLGLGNTLLASGFADNVRLYDDHGHVSLDGTVNLYSGSDSAYITTNIDIPEGAPIGRIPNVIDGGNGQDDLYVDGNAADVYIEQSALGFRIFTAQPGNSHLTQIALVSNFERLHIGGITVTRDELGDFLAQSVRSAAANSYTMARFRIQDNGRSQPMEDVEIQTNRPRNPDGPDIEASIVPEIKNWMASIDSTTARTTHPSGLVTTSDPSTRENRLG